MSSDSASVRNNEEKEKEVNNEDGLTCENESYIHATDDNDATLYGHTKGNIKAMSWGYEHPIAQTDIQYRNYENASIHGINLDKNFHQRKEIALRAVANKTRYTAGILVVAGRYLLGPEVVNDQLKMKRHVEEVQSERDNKKIDAHMALAKRFYVIITLKNSLQSGQSWRKRKQWRCVTTSKQAIFYYQQ